MHGTQLIKHRVNLGPIFTYRISQNLVSVTIFHSEEVFLWFSPSLQFGLCTALLICSKLDSSFMFQLLLLKMQLFDPVGSNGYCIYHFN
jgi:hypothetical protein